MSQAGARGLTGAEAIRAIIRNFERPADPQSSIAAAIARYGQMGGGGQIAAGPAMPQAGGNPLAMALLERVRGGRKKPSIMELVQLAQEGQTPNGADGRAPATSLQPSGGWGGSKGIAGSLIAGLGLNVTSTKRDRKSTASGGVSDHWTGSRNAFAYDLGGSVAQMDRAAVQLARRLGISYRRGQPLVATVNRNGYRIQVIYRSNVGGNHFDHLHIGVRRL